MTKTKDKNSRASSRKGTIRNHPWILALIIILIIFAAVAIIVFVVKPKPTNTLEPSNPVTSDPAEPTTPDSPESPAETSAEPPESPEKAPQYEGENPNNLEELTGVVISKDVENGTLTIMATINQYLHETGICVITFVGRNSHNSYTASADAHADISTSYCENFDIPITGFASDVYDIKIELSGDGKIGTIYDEVSL